jgi:hypothetical protein
MSAYCALQLGAASGAALTRLDNLNAVLLRPTPENKPRVLLQPLSVSGGPAPEALDHGLPAVSR